MQKLQFIFLAILISISFSCQDDDVSVEVLSFDIDLSSNLNDEAFVLITDQDKEIIYSGFGPELVGSATFDKNPGDIIDLTYGRKGSSFFSIYTYRNINPNFKINSQFKPADFVDNNSAERKIIISGFQGLVISNPLREFDYLDGNTVLSDTRSEQDLIITVFDEQTNLNKSILLNADSWVLQNDGSYLSTLSISDFENSVEHSIALTHFSDRWILDAYANLDNDVEVVIYDFKNTQDYVSGEIIKIYTTPGFTFETLDISIRDAFQSEGFGYQGYKLNSFPDRVDFSEMEVDFIEWDDKSYNIFNDAQYDLACVDYEYIIDNSISRWSIYQSREETLEYKLPSLPTDFLDNADIVNDNIDKPERLYARYFQLADGFDSSGFDDNLHVRLDCQNHTETYHSEAE